MSEGRAEDLETTVNETLRLLMTRTGKRQVDVAAAIGISRVSLSQRLLGNSAWKLNDLPKAAGYFGLTVAELLSGYAAIAQADRLPPVKGSKGQPRKT